MTSTRVHSFWNSPAAAVASNNMCYIAMNERNPAVAANAAWPMPTREPLILAMAFFDRFDTFSASPPMPRSAPLNCSIAAVPEAASTLILNSRLGMAALRAPTELRVPLAQDRLGEYEHHVFSR